MMREGQGHCRRTGDAVLSKDGHNHHLHLQVPHTIAGTWDEGVWAVVRRQMNSPWDSLPVVCGGDGCRDKLWGNDG